ncbi:MAG: hypothetical protein WC314_19110 [Vulcanimicrobiota bacterium]
MNRMESLKVIKDTNLGTHLSDLKAYLTHFESVVAEQLQKAESKTDRAYETTFRLHTLISSELAKTTAACNLYATNLQTVPKELLTKFLGTAAGFYNRMRDYPMTRAVRDNYTALTLLAASYTALKTYSLMVHREDVSLLAYEALEKICPMIIELSDLLPQVVARETALREGLVYDEAVIDRVTNAVRRCWHQ